ncbi:MAG: APC family permease [Terriglobia bacterium]
MNPATQQPSNHATKPGLRRELRLADSTAIVVGIVIGSGIFVVPNAIAGALTSPASALLVWIAGGAFSLFGALSVAELSAMYPGAGGFYTFLRAAYGDRAGFLYTWGFLLIMNTGSLSALAVAFGIYSAQFFALGPLAQKAVAASVLLLLTGVNCLGVRAGKWVQNIFTLAKVSGIAVMCVLIFARRTPFAANAGSFWPDSLALGWTPFTQFGIALVAVMWAFEGWAWVSFSGAEMKNPARDLPRALFYGTVIITMVYLVASTAYYSALRVDEVAGAERVAADAMTRVAGPVAAGFISLLALVSIFGSINGTMLTGPRCYYAMAADGLFFRPFARIHPRFHTPVFSIVVQGLWGALLALFLTFEELFTAVIFTSFISYTAAVVAVIVLRRKQPDRPRPYRVPAYPWLPLLFCLAALLVLAGAIESQPGYVGGASLLILAGLLVYAFLRRSRTPNTR